MPGPSPVRELRDALVDAFTQAQLEQLALFHLNVRLDAILRDAPLQQRAFELILWARSHGRVSDLITGAVAENPGNQKLRAFVDNYGIAPVFPATDDAQRPGTDFRVLLLMGGTVCVLATSIIVGTFLLVWAGVIPAAYLSLSLVVFIIVTLVMWRFAPRTTLMVAV
jgi:hypothetical protein